MVSLGLSGKTLMFFHAIWGTGFMITKVIESKSSKRKNKAPKRN